ncbi:hypothetical protein GH714_022952 [Hevea brasiliensis]|uniref:TF-B3 domain-containing protein n=1 Tax=Hevea brasiliensis TaxID=3981 RepID=A0A6A6M3P3_HEVBR|nr:hypothetical protein GH714_022952 [Hevea brasiliensis]
MARAFPSDFDDDGYFDRMVEKAKVEHAAIKLLAEDIMFTFMQCIREETMRSKDLLAAYAMRIMVPCGEESQLCLRKWNLEITSSYVLTSWNKVLVRKEFKQNDVIQLWSFRVQRELHLALIKVALDGGNNGDGASVSATAGASASHDIMESQDGDGDGAGSTAGASHSIMENQDGASAGANLITLENQEQD